MKIIRLKTKLGFLILSKSKPEIILIIFFAFFLFCLQSKIYYKTRIKMQNSYESEQEQNTKVSNNS